MTVIPKFRTRKETRNCRVFGKFPGKLLYDEKEDEVYLRPIDVSPRGLGFLSREEMVSGSQCWFEIGDLRVRVEIVYCQTYLGIDNLYRCGLFVRDEDINLAAIFAALGLLESQASVDDEQSESGTLSEDGDKSTKISA